jgi:hypothetical protein
MSDAEYELLIWAENRDQWDEWIFCCESRQGTDRYFDIQAILINNRNRFSEQPPIYIGATTE